MPRQTFYNLPAEKRKWIEQVAMEEFAARDYRDVYVTTIIKRSGIADGSFYQYFSDKKDLFMHLLESIKETKMLFLKRGGSGSILQNGDFRSFVKAAITDGIMFGLQNPLQMRFYDRVMESPLKEDAVEKVKNAALDYWRSLVERGIADKKIRDDIPVEIASRALSAASLDLSRYIVEKFDLRSEKKRGKKTADQERQKEIVEEFAEQFVSIFLDGLKT